MADANTGSTSRLFAAVREAQDESLRLGDANEHARARARARLLQAIDQSGQSEGARAPLPSRAPWRWGLAGLAAAACAFAIVFALPGDDALEFEVDGVELAAMQRVVADDGPRTLSFSDDTTVALAPGARIYIDDLRSNGATVVLESGAVDLSVHHERDTSWQVAAGPWSVHVTGTQFSVEWEPSTEHFRVAVLEGSVRVEGPEGQVAELRGGDTFVPQRGKATIEPERASTDTSAPAVAAAERREHEASAETSEGEGQDAVTDAPMPKAKVRRWTDDFDDADYEGAWQALEDRPGGILAEASQASSSALLDLADVARYTKHDDDALAVLEILRERFPGTAQAAEAAFTLGRLAAKGGDATKATIYFELYLDERPEGSHADDALGRLIDSYDAAGSKSKAAAAASRYLERFPGGPHADKAAKLLGQ